MPDNENSTPYSDSEKAELLEREQMVLNTMASVPTEEVVVNKFLGKGERVQMERIPDEKSIADEGKLELEMNLDPCDFDHF